MNQEYHDITSRLGEPLWHDEYGVPRYDSFAPDMCNDIYADEAVLLEIACQRCRQRFRAAMTWGHVRAASCGLFDYSLAQAIAEGTIHYGDPPHHDDPAGNTMNCDDLRVLEYWHRGKDTGYEWARDARLEASVG